MTASPIAPNHPGEILGEEYLGPLGITPTYLTCRAGCVRQPSTPSHGLASQ